MVIPIHACILWGWHPAANISLDSDKDDYPSGIADNEEMKGKNEILWILRGLSNRTPSDICPLVSQGVQQPKKSQYQHETNQSWYHGCLFFVYQLQTHTNPLVKIIGPFNNLFDYWKSLGKHTRSHHFSSVVLSFLQPPCLQYLPPGHVKAHFPVSFTFPAALPAQSLAPL